MAERLHQLMHVPLSLSDNDRVMIAVLHEENNRETLHALGHAFADGRIDPFAWDTVITQDEKNVRTPCAFQFSDTAVF